MTRAVAVKEAGAGSLRYNPTAVAAKARITSEFATPREVASRLQIPPSRAAELRQQLFDLQLRRPDGPLAGVDGKVRRDPRAAAPAKKK